MSTLCTGLQSAVPVSISQVMELCKHFCVDPVLFAINYYLLCRQTYYFANKIFDVINMQTAPDPKR